MKLIFEDNTNYQITSKEDIAKFLSKLGMPGNSFTILENGAAFIQAAGNPKDGFVIEYKLESGELYASQKQDFTKAQVINSFQNYYGGDAKWKSETAWKLLDVFETDSVKNKKSSNKYLIFLLIGIVFPLIGAYLGINNYILINKYYKVDGIVKGFTQKSGNNNSGITYTPVVEYQVNDEVYQLVGSVSSNPPAYDLNEHVEVLYEQGNPHKAMINSFIELWFVVILFILLGSISLIIGIFLKRKKDKQNKIAAKGFSR